MCSEWKKTRLGDCISLRGGFAYKSEFLGRGESLLFGMGVVSHTEKFLLSGAREYSGIAPETHKTQPGELVIATRQQSDNMPILGAPGFVPKELKGKNLIVGANLYKVTNISSISNDFLYWLMKGDDYKNRILECSKGSTVRMITKDAIEDFVFYCPPVDERNRIVNVLNTIDDRITLLRETNATLEAIAQTLFKSWFVDFDPVHARAGGEQPAGLPPEVAALFPDSFEESALGMIPKGWRVDCIGHLGEVVCGKTPPTSDPDNYGEDVPFITIPDMHGYLAVTSTARSLSRKGADSQPKKYLPAGSICVSCIATPGLVVQVTESSHTNQQINSVIPHLEWGRSFPLFLLRRIGDKVRAGGSGGSVFHNLSKSSFEKIPELLPTNNLAQQYCQIVDPLVEKIIDNQRQAQTLATLRDTLLPRLISGQLRLPEAEAQLSEAGLCQ
ncbi:MULTISPECIES: restriction endonuclease subunit S [Aeromonas]|uniref:restriction endonuclease subunit S n=1 Tax=Aeromonas TaxID=642 RepID=UPI0022E528B0|nr:MULTISPECIES: restriction endonuclease subunit S [Aeromonas]